MRKICDELFGASNFINQVIWTRNSSGKTVSKQLTVNIEYLLIYGTIGETVSNIKDDRTDLDLLYACLLDWGVEISLPHTAETVDGCTVHDVDNGALTACFNEHVPASVVEHMAKQQPLRAVFRDSAFASDADKINVTEIFKNLSPDTKVKVI